MQLKTYNAQAAEILMYWTHKDTEPLRRDWTHKDTEPLSRRAIDKDTEPLSRRAIEIDGYWTSRN